MPLRSAMTPRRRWALQSLGAPGALYHHRADYRDHRQHGGLNRLCRAGGAARHAFPVRPLHRTLLIASALAGAILMVLADIASRMLIAPQSLPVGVVTALVGVPFFAVIIYRSRNK
jgi:hypothetical protein